MIVGQVGQSLDGRVATATGHSKYHQLPGRHRASAPAARAGRHRRRRRRNGAGRQSATDGQAGRGPAAGARRDRSERASGSGCQNVRRRWRSPPADHGRWRCRTPPPGVEIVTLPAQDGNIAPSAIVAALARAGMRRILIEGGADTVSRFIAARCLDRLHVNVAPSCWAPEVLGSTCRRSIAPTRRAVCRFACTRSRTMCCSTAICRISGSRIGDAKKST